MEEIPGLDELQEIISNSDNIVFFGGAGVSTESGIPDFRSQDGLYSKVYKYPPEVIISHTFFLTHTEEFFQFYKQKMLLLDKKPNAAHIFLTELEKAGKLKAVITQNIDGLHQMAGSKKVLELHGSVHRNYCMKCHHEFSAEYVKNSPSVVPYCNICGGVIKPDVVLYEEGLDEHVIEESIEYIQKADAMIVAGTSLVVYPAAGLINYYKGNKLVLINKTATGLDGEADLVIHHAVGDLFKRLHV